jgi:tRNA pseudouridine55 synthase
METDSLDLQGAVVRTAAAPDPAVIDWDALLPRFVGEQLQVPPAVSALRVDGVRSYDLARQGKAVELPARPVVIRSLERLSGSFEGDVVLRLRCSKGTYVRSLARDLGAALSCPACVSLLRRTAIGPWRVPDWPTFSEDAPEPPLLPVADFLADWPCFEVEASGRQALRTGKSLCCPLPDADRVLAMEAGTALAAGRVAAGVFRPWLLLIDAQ